MKIFDELDISNRLCFDVGSNIGDKTDKFLTKGASVICIEPQEYCVSQLQMRYGNNDRVKILKTALGSKDTVGLMHISNSHTLSTLSLEFISETSKQRFVGNIWSEKEQVNITTLDKIIEKYGEPKYCKIDVEGYEVEILKGLSSTIEYISIEFVPELKKNTFDSIEIINRLGNYRFNYVEGESENFQFEEWIESQRMIEFLMKNKDYRKSFGDVYAKLYKI